MALRIRRCLGFAVTDLIDGATDSRLKVDLTDPKTFEEEHSLDEFRTFYQLHEDHKFNFTLLDILFYKRLKQTSNTFTLSQLTEYEDETGIPGVLLFYPPEIVLGHDREKWYRYDDIIDWIEYRKDTRPRLDLVETPIYPFKEDVPMSIYMVMAFMGIFNDPWNEFKGLEPVVYTFWR